MIEPFNSNLPSGLGVFDVCETLYFSNTTHDFIRFIVSKTRKRRTSHFVLNSKFLLFRYLFIAISRYLGADPLREFNVRLLEGYSRDELDEYAREFVGSFLNDRKITRVHEMLEDSRARNRRIVLCSTSIEPVVEAIAEELGVEHFVCSTIQFADGISTGRIVDEVGTAKLGRLKRLGLGEDIDIAVSDNRGDLELLKAATRGVAVVHSARKETFWRAHDVEILRPNS